MNERPDRPSNASLRAQLTQLPIGEELAARQRLFARSRRITGAWLGFGIGLIYLTSSALINTWNLPGLPLYVPPPGMPWLAILGALLCGLVGLICAWSETSVIGMLWGGLAGALLFDIYAVVNSLSDRLPMTLIAAFLVLIILPVAAMAAMVIGLFRWTINRQQTAWQDKGSFLVRAGIPVLLLSAALGLGYLSSYPPEGQQLVRRMNQILQTAQRSQGPLPAELNSDSIQNFNAYAKEAYTLEWSKDPTNRYAIPRPANSAGRESIVVARFPQGYQLICLFPNPDAAPECVSRQYTSTP